MWVLKINQDTDGVNFNSHTISLQLFDGATPMSWVNWRCKTNLKAVPSLFLEIFPYNSDYKNTIPLVRNRSSNQHNDVERNLETLTYSVGTEPQGQSENFVQHLKRNRSTIR